MDRVVVDGTALSWVDDPSGARLEVGTSDAGGPSRAARSAFRLTPEGGRIRVGMALIPTTRVVDISIQPSVLMEVLPIDVGSCRPGSSGSVAARWVARLSERSSIWHPSDPDSAGLIRTVGGGAFPLLGAAYDRGASPVREIPRWAACTLTRTSARDAARAAFTSKATRPVIAGLARGLVQRHREQPDDPDPVEATDGGGGVTCVSLLGIGLALMGDPVLEPDDLARLLGQDCSDCRPALWPTSQQIALFRGQAPMLGRTRASRLLVEAATRADGIRLLSRIITALDHVGHLLPRTIANRLEDLDHQCHELLPIDPNPTRGRWGPLPQRSTRPAPPAPPRPRAVPPGRPGEDLTADLQGPPDHAPRAPAPADPRRRALLAPHHEDHRSPAPGDSGLRDTIRALHGAAPSDGLVLIVPRSGAELQAWGRRFANCVGGYSAAVEAGRSHIVGVELHEALTYCLEIKPDRTIRQFLGYRNRAVPREHTTVVARYLVARGALDAGNRANRVWL